MKQALLSCITVVVCLGLLLAAAPDAPSLPQYTTDNQLLRPEGYREWIYLSSGLGMNYSPVAGHEMFTNVFVPQWAYREFLKSGKWPDKSMFVVEERGSQSKGSINKAGHFQTDLMGMGVEVKDSRISTSTKTPRRPRPTPRLAAGSVTRIMPRSNTLSCSFIRR